jgi:hypothetical protein
LLRRPLGKPLLREREEDLRDLARAEEEEEKRRRGTI